MKKIIISIAVLFALQSCSAQVIEHNNPNEDYGYEIISQHTYSLYPSQIQKMEGCFEGLDLEYYDPDTQDSYYYNYYDPSFDTINEKVVLQLSRHDSYYWDFIKDLDKFYYGEIDELDFPYGIEETLIKDADGTYDFIWSVVEYKWWE